MAYKTYRELIAWQRAMDLVEEVYRATATFPREELYGLVCQLRRAGVSVPSNIAEGQGRRSVNEFLQFLSVAYGSLREMETQLLISKRLGFLEKDRSDALLDRTGEVGRLINGLSNSLRSR